MIGQIDICCAVCCGGEEGSDDSIAKGRYCSGHGPGRR